MSNKTNERFEREARESLVASDLSAKMKQWRDEPPLQNGGKSSKFRLLFMLLFFGGVAWWFWPKAESDAAPRLESPAERQQTPMPQHSTPAPTEPSQAVPMAQKPASNRHLTLAQAQYKTPNFAADIRGDAPATENALNDARQALAEKHPADALDALQNVPAAYQTDADYLRGHALFGMKKYTQAAAVFGTLTSSIRYSESAQWFGTLALLPSFERDKVVIMSRLNKIAEDEGHTFQREAKALIGKLALD